jgi:hypothetical protein
MIITSEMIFIVFSAKKFEVIFEKRDRSYAFDFQQSRRQAPVGEIKSQISLGFCDIMNQKQNMQTKG